MAKRLPGEPNRLSRLNSLTKCAALVAARSAEGDTPSGPAADLGTGVGRGEELWHRGYTLDKVLEILQEEKPTNFPLADKSAAPGKEELPRLVTAYCNDPRNLPHYVLMESLEQEVTLTIPCDQDDPTGLPIVLKGHTDQVRWANPEHPEKEAFGLQLWDAKNGKASGDDMLGDYAFQLAAYTLGLQETFPDLYKGNLTTGGVIRTRGYICRGKKDPGTHRVFFHAGWSSNDCRVILSTVSYLIGQIRAGAIPHTPGAHCRYCPLEFPGCATGNLERMLQDPQ